MKIDLTCGYTVFVVWPEMAEYYHRWLLINDTNVLALRHVDMIKDMDSYRAAGEQPAGEHTVFSSVRVKR